MLRQIDVMTRSGLVLPLQLSGEDNVYAVREIEGLDPVKANLVSTSYAGVDGEQFQAAKRGPRNIKIELDLQPDFSSSTFTDLRNDLYNYFMPKSQIDLRFYDHTGLYLDITGVVETFDSPLFEQDPDVQISLMCYQPDFVDPRMVLLTGNSVATTVTRDIIYPGTVETGIVFSLLANRDVPAFSLYNTGPDGVPTQLDFAAPLLSGDRLDISSITGGKAITLTRAGVSSSYLYGRTAQSTWIQFAKGTNHFRAYVPGDPVPYEIRYGVRYGGL